MTRRNGKPCKKCGTSDWHNSGNCKKCSRVISNTWYKNNKDKNRDKEQARRRKYIKDNPEIISAQNRRYAKENPEKNRENVRQWKKNNPNKVAVIAHCRRTRKTNAGGSYTENEWIALCKQYDNRCLKCGRDDVKITADHVIPVALGGSSDISNIQPLCQSCNSSKGAMIKDYRTMPIAERWHTIPMFDWRVLGFGHIGD